MSTPKITTICRTTINEMDWSLPENIFYNKRQRSNHKGMHRRGELAILSNSYVPRGQPSNWTITTIYCRVFPQDREF